MSDDMQELMDSLHKTCVSNVGVSEDLITRAQKGDFVDDEDVKCYMRCVLDEIGVIEDNGTLDIDGIIGVLPDEIKDDISGTVKKCGVIVGANECETAYLFNKCSYEDNPTLYSLP